MKFFLVFAFVVCAVHFKPAMSAGCRVVCRLRCSWSGCRYRCYLRCSGGKRSISERNNDDAQRIPFPEKFGKYDLDKNGGITLEELAIAINVAKHAKGTEEAFRQADKDGDGQINCEEFMKAPYLFAHRPSCGQ